VAVEGPAVVAGAEGQWAAASEEVRAASDESLAAEKEAEAGGLEVSVPVYQEGAVLAQSAAAKGVAMGTGYIAAAQVMHMLSLALKAPVALVVSGQWLAGACSTVGIACGASCSSLCGVPGAGGAAGGVPAMGASGALMLQAMSMAANTAFALALTSSLLVPWADTVVAAAAWQDGGGILSQLSSLPNLVRKALPAVGPSSGNAGGGTRPKPESRALKRVHREVEEQSRLHRIDRATQEFQARDHAAAVADARARRLWPGRASAPSRDGAGDAGSRAARPFTRLWGWQDALNLTGSLLHQGQEEAGTLAQATGDKVREEVPVVESALGNAAKVAGDKAKEVAGATRDRAIDTAKGIYVKKPNTATTTVAPFTTPPPPPAVPHWHLLRPGAERLARSVLHWMQPVALDVALGAVAFAAVGLTTGVGRQLPALRCGTSRGERLASLAVAFREALGRCLWGAAGLLAVWVLSVLLANELRPYAEVVQGVPLIATAQVLGAVCMGLCLAHAILLSRRGCDSKGGQAYAPGKTEAAVASPDAEATAKTGGYIAVPVNAGLPPLDMEQGKCCTSDPGCDQGSRAVLGTASSAASCVCALVAAAASAILGAMEGPLFTWALGGTYQSACASWWLLGILPWDMIAPTMLGWRLPPWILLSAVAIPAVLLGGLLHVARGGGQECWAKPSQPPPLSPLSPGASISPLASPRETAQFGRRPDSREVHNMPDLGDADLVTLQGL